MELHGDLEKFNPGCRIPELPEKNYKTNYVENKEFLEKRKMAIQKYLQYVINHSHLRKNSSFVHFLSNVKHVNLIILELGKISKR